MADDFFKDPRDDTFIEQLSQPELDAAVAAMRRLSFFHTLDIMRDTGVRSVHRSESFRPDFLERVEAWLTKHQIRLGLRGPLPGHPALGARWGFYDIDSDPRQ